PPPNPEPGSVSMKSPKHRKLAALAGPVLLLAACGAPGPQSPATPVASACSTAAQAFAVPGVRITEAEPIAGDTVRPAGTTTGPLLAAHCRIQGRMNERVGVDNKPYYIGFELRLPAQWNGRFLYQGGGGNDGVIRPAIGPQAAPGYALNRGFAVVTTDAGHQDPSANFGFDPVARVDNAYNAHDRVAVTAKEIIRRWYGQPAAHSYFIGCSGGGRQGMMFTQRFPNYFDGVIAMAPAMRVSKGATIAAAWDTQQLAAIAPAGTDGKPVLSQALTDGDLGLVRNAILKSCDAQDGLADGLVSNPAACKFDVRSLQCRGAKAADC